ncbi:MAG TPA: hypothetical protein VL948_15220 [Verrucomicrobiae bacterium]|nr:hypothetical protein [Verrucomicrobiae bacterium]
MRGRPLALLWFAVIGVLFLVNLVAFYQWRSLAGRGARVTAQRTGLGNEIRAHEGEIVALMRANAGLLQEMQWTSSGGDPAAFLTRLGDLAREKRMKVIGIGPLERASTAQFTKSWHTIQVVAPYRELRELAARVEAEKGILEDVSVRVPRSGSARPDEIEAHFKMTALELTPAARKVFDRAVASAGPGPQGTSPGGSLALPLPAEGAGAVAARDPFTFTAGTRRPPVATAPTGPGGPPPVEAERSDVEVKGIFGFPGGFLAIVNNQIVKAGDTVAGYRVERITEGTVVLRERGGGSRVMTLPALSTAPTGAPRR